MASEVRRRLCLVAFCLAPAIGYPPKSTSALDTANVLMGIDGMVMTHQGLFRNATPNDGAQTFSFGTFQAAPGTLGRYKSFYLVETGEDDCCISHRIRLESWSPEVFVDTDYVAVAPLDVTSDYFPLIDRASFGQRFDPEDYEIEVQFKPNLGAPFPPAQQNQAATMSVSFDLHFGFVFDAETGIYKRSTEQIFYNIGDDETPINSWYATAEKDAEGFATWSVPVLDYENSGRSTYYNYGDGAFRDDHVVPGGGREFNADTSMWEDVNVAYDGFMQFGGGPTDPSRPGSKLDTPNGASLLYFGAPGGDANVLSVEIKSIALKKIDPGPIAARLDADSGLSARFGSGFTRGPNFDPITIPGDGFPYLPRATDQISRFDENGMTNLIFNMREPDDPNEVHRFFLRYAPGPNTFDGTDATVNVRARLTEPLAAGIAQNLTLVAKDLDGNDMAANEGADEYTYDLDLNQFNTDTFTTVSIPLSAFTLSMHVPRTDTEFGSGPGGFMNAGDEMLTDFNLYEFGGVLASNSGVLRLELEFMEIRLPEMPGGLAGDYNEDGVVNAADYVVWRNHDGTAFDLPNRNPLLSGNIGQSDYDFWVENFGNTGSGGAGLATVPEPTTLALLAGSWLFLFVTRSRRVFR
jgi:hypothetical protein